MSFYLLVTEVELKIRRDVSKLWAIIHQWSRRSVDPESRSRLEAEGEPVMVNSEVSSWFCRTNHPLICHYPGNASRDSPSNFNFDLLVICAETGNEILKALLTGSDNRIVFPVDIEGFKAWGMTWAAQAELVRMALSCVISSQSIPLVVENQLETWGGQFFWNLTVKRRNVDIRVIFSTFQFDFGKA